MLKEAVRRHGRNPRQVWYFLDALATWAVNELRHREDGKR